MDRRLRRAGGVLDIGSPVTPPVSDSGPDPNRHHETLQRATGRVLHSSSEPTLAWL
jgi:hypothetical protein